MKSDVHAFGVVILEIFTQGELPFPKMNDNSFLTKLKEKTLEWKSHKNTPTDLQKLQVIIIKFKNTFKVKSAVIDTFMNEITKKTA